MPNHTELLELLLRNRGISLENQEKFLNPKYEDLYDPFLLKDIEKACIRIFEAIEANEKVVIYTDYDCDGIPSAVIMNDLFKKVGFKNYVIYIPHRHDEGYGLHQEAIDEFIKNQTNLLTTYPGVKGIKTGYTDESGWGLITYAENGDAKILGVILDAVNRKYDGILLLDYCFGKEGIEIYHNLL